MDNDWLDHEQIEFAQQKKEANKHKRYNEDTMRMIKLLVFLFIIVGCLGLSSVEGALPIKPEKKEAEWQCKRCGRCIWKQDPPYECPRCGCPIGQR